MKVKNEGNIKLKVKRMKEILEAIGGQKKRNPKKQTLKNNDRFTSPK